MSSVRDIPAFRAFMSDALLTWLMERAEAVPGVDGLAQLGPCSGLETPDAMRFVRELYTRVHTGVAEGKDLKTIYRETYTAMQPRYGNTAIFDHCMPFDVSRAYDEARGIVHPRIWTAERDREMWAELEG